MANTTATKPAATPAAGAPGQSTAQSSAQQQSGLNRGPNNYTGQAIVGIKNGVQQTEGIRPNVTQSEQDARRARLNEQVAALEAKKHRSAALEALLKRRKGSPGLSCKPSADVYSSLTDLKTAKGSRPVDAQWICGIDHLLKFDERDNWSVQDNEFRVFIEGAEVSNYLEGSLSWTSESTGGTNTCRLTLNNTQDAFIVTPMNICAGPYEDAGWRLSYIGSKGQPPLVNVSSSRDSWRVDEVAKWQIYRRKFQAVAPSKDDRKQIDADTGMWLYPLNPFSCIFNRHDVVRVFIKIPHIGGYSRKINKNNIYYDFWMPVFTGFIKDYSWNDDPIGGKRSVNITAYDYRGLMERMRVRVYAGRVEEGPQEQNNAAAGHTVPGTSIEPDKANAALAASQKWLDCAVKAGNHWAAKLASYTYFFGLWGTGIKANPFNYAQDILSFAATFDDLHAMMLFSAMKVGGKDKKGCASGNQKQVNYRQGSQAQTNVDFDGKCGVAALRDADTYASDLSCKYINIIGQIMNILALAYNLAGIARRVYFDVTTTTKKTKNGSKRVITCKLQDVGGATGSNRTTTKHYAISVAGVLDEMSKYANGIAEESAKKGLEAYITSVTLISLAGAGSSADTQKIEAIRKLQQQQLDDLATYFDTQLLAKINPQNKLLKATTQTPADFSAEDAIKQATPIQASINAKKKALEKATTAEQKKALQDEINALSLKIQAITKAYDQTRTTKYKIKNVGLSGEAEWQTYLSVLKIPDISFRAYVEQEIGNIGSANTALTATEQQRVLRKFVQFIKIDIVQKLAASSAAAKTLADTVIADAQKFVGAPGDQAGAGTLNHILNQVDRKIQELEKQLPEEMKKGRGLANIKEIREKLRTVTADGKDKVVRAGNVAEAVLKYANFETKHAGIFADLVSKIKDQPHPLADKSFEQAVEYLCCEQQKILPGVVDARVGNYANDVKVMDPWNRMVLFGVIGRPLTFQEVTLVGENSVSDHTNEFSPYNVFYHMLLPAAGTGAATIIQKDTGRVGINSMTLQYETRKSLLDNICSVLDYQFFVSGWGDLIFEFPHYNSFPQDFGKVFEGAYTVAKDWKSATISDEATDIPTAWVITGLASEEKLGKATGSAVAKSELETVPIIMPILARRLGVKVENINLRIPGVGSPTNAGVDAKQAKDQLRVYGMFHIQRTIGRAQSLSVSIPFRPYFVPNRPLYFIPRQRIGLSQSVTHTMNFPNGDCTTDCAISYVKFLFRDGTFRYMGGGQRMPIDYTSFFTGIPPKEYKEGTGVSGTRSLVNKSGKSTPRGQTSVACTGDLSRRAREASAFSAEVANQWGAPFNVSFRVLRPSFTSSQAVDLRLTGIRETGGLRGAQSINTASGDPMQYVHNNPWQYSTKQALSGFGYLRHFSSGSLGGYEDAQAFQTGAQRDYSHSGWDIKIRVGATALAPVDIYSARAVLITGIWAGMSKFAYVLLGSEKEANAKYLEPFKVRWGGRTPKQFTDAQGRTWVKVYGEQWLFWKALGGASSNIEARYASAGGGLILSAEGNVQLPKLDNQGSIPATLTYVHLHDLKRITVGGKEHTIGGTLRQANKNKTEPIVKAGEPIAYCGTSGTDNPHLHFCLELHADKVKTRADAEQLRTAVAANKDFIDAQLKARAEFYKFDGSDPRGNFKDGNQAAAAYWQRYKYQIKGNKAKGPVTINDVIKFYQNRKQYQRYVPSDLNKAKGVYVNPAFFFTIDQLVGKERVPIYQRYGPFKQNALYLEKSANTWSQARRSACKLVGPKIKSLIARREQQCQNLYNELSTVRNNYMATRNIAGLNRSNWALYQSTQDNYNNCIDEVKTANDKLKYSGCEKVFQDQAPTWKVDACMKSYIVLRAVDDELRKTTARSIAQVRATAGLQTAGGTNFIPDTAI